MSEYIEKERRGEFFNPTSSTVEINPKDKVFMGNLYWNENIERWKWLTEGWKNMTFKERMSLFIPYMHYINLRDFQKQNVDEGLNDDIQLTEYNTCRTFKKLHFELDSRGVPIFLAEFNLIDCNAIPDASLKTEVYNWGVQYGFIS